MSTYDEHIAALKEFVRLDQAEYVKMWEDFAASAEVAGDTKQAAHYREVADRERNRPLPGQTAA